MTFIDITGGRPSGGLIAGYSLLTVYSLALAVWAVYLGGKRLHYRSFVSVRVLFPLALLILALENASLASSGRLYDNLISDEAGNNFDHYVFIDFVFVVQTFEVPILLIVIFELTYLVHKRRSVNFCGMYFDEGRRVDNTAVMSCMLRNSIRTLAFVLLVMGLMVNFDKVFGAPVDELAGRAGWWPLFQDDASWDEKVHLLLSLIPTAILALVSFYLSIMLWRYGTESAMVVHSSMLNPWFYSFFGTVALAVGQFFGEKLYPIMSNTGMLIFNTTILALMTEVDKDIVATYDVACFLVQVAQKGDQIRVSRSIEQLEQRLSGEEQEENHETISSEEKVMESLDETVCISNSTSTRSVEGNNTIKGKITNNKEEGKLTSCISSTNGNEKEAADEGAQGSNEEMITKERIAEKNPDKSNEREASSSEPVDNLISPSDIFVDREKVEASIVSSDDEALASSVSNDLEEGSITNHHFEHSKVGVRSCQ
mmetsp:Transcript_15052/g.30623  ORF Transcript_15052/g.30623 Transcript_15052/m.30623 type:complete len:484 (-) Transcript_15052:273-1724(-)